MYIDRWQECEVPSQLSTACGVLAEHPLRRGGRAQGMFAASI
ncbi:hypothetical protein SZ54_1858 [Rhizobium sp. UR51a]|nr:hypothetical protein SZ54_1858 [Rhizobium sp. UR51a]